MRPFLPLILLAACEADLAAPADDTGAATVGAAEPEGAADTFTIAPIAACGGNYGAILDRWTTTGADIPAYSNGTCTGGGSGVYQCVQLTDRVHMNTRNHIGNAESYDDPVKARAMFMMFMANGGAHAPMVGDAVISSGGGYGHIGVIKSLSSTRATVLHQNWSSSRGTIDLTRSGTSLGGFSGTYPVSGFSRPGADFGSQNGDSTAALARFTRNAASILSVGATDVRLDPGSDPYLTGPDGLMIDPTFYKKVRVRMRSSCPDGNVQVFYRTTNDGVFNQAKSKRTVIANNGTWTEAVLDFSGDPSWVYGGRVQQLRLDPCDNGVAGSADSVTLDWLRLEP